MVNFDYDCSGWATKANVRCYDGLVIAQDAFKECSGKVVPMVYNHDHSNVDNVIGKDLSEILAPGNGILSSIQDPAVRDLTNVFLVGTFKGKLNDWDGDGLIDVNSRDVYSTVDGEVDMNQDGIADEPGRTCCNHRNTII